MTNFNPVVGHSVTATLQRDAVAVPLKKLPCTNKQCRGMDITWPIEVASLQAEIGQLSLTICIRVEVVEDQPSLVARAVNRGRVLQDCQGCRRWS